MVLKELHTATKRRRYVPAGGAHRRGPSPLAAMASSAVNKAMQCWKTIMDWIDGAASETPLRSFASFLPSGQNDIMKRIESIGPALTQLLFLTFRRLLHFLLSMGTRILQAGCWQRGLQSCRGSEVEQTPLREISFSSFHVHKVKALIALTKFWRSFVYTFTNRISVLLFHAMKIARVKLK